MSLPRRPSHATVVAYLALFVALAGSSFAAVHLGKNSVTAKAIKKGAVKRAKIANDAIDSSKVQTGSLLPSDVQGGLLPVGAVGSGTLGTSQPPASPLGTSTFQAQTSVTTTEPSRLLVFGSSTSSVTCNGGGPCGVAFGVYVDGQPIPDSGDGVFAIGSQTASATISPMGITGQLPAGAHTVALDGALVSGANVSVNANNNRHVAAIAVKP